MEKGLEQIIFVLKLHQELKWMNDLWIRFAIFTEKGTSAAECHHLSGSSACISGMLHFSEPLKDQLL